MNIAKNYRMRLGLVFLFFFCLFIAIILRLYITQIHHHDFYVERARKQYQTQIKKPHRRATIYDRNNQPLALNRLVQSAFVVPAQCVKSKKTMGFLKRVYPQTHQKVLKNKNKKFMWVARHLKTDGVQKIKNADLDQLFLTTETQRFAPYSAVLPIVGLTDIDNTGVSGIELVGNQTLRGSPTVYQLLKEARSGKYYFDKVVTDHGVLGKDLHLTLDNTLQYLAHKEVRETVEHLGATKGAALILNPDTGEVIVMATHDTQATKRHQNNFIVTEHYELGSVVKIFSALACLHNEVVTLDETIDCEGKRKFFGSFKVENWKPLGVLSFKDVVRRSSNVGIAKVISRVDDRLFDCFIDLGFGRKTGIEFPGERAGFVNAPNHWSKYSPIVLSFGYELMGTLLQVGKALSIVANGGYEIQPRLIKKDEQPTKGKQLFKPTAIANLKEILRDPQTLFAATRKRNPVTGFKLYGKTGTARQVVDGKYSETNHVYTFAGFIEKGDYRRVIVTFVKNPANQNVWASQVSAPLFQRIAQKVAIHDLTHHDETLIQAFRDDA